MSRNNEAASLYIENPIGVSAWAISMAGAYSAFDERASFIINVVYFTINGEGFRGGAAAPRYREG